MKLIYACLLVCAVSLSLTGCGDSEENALATDGATVDEFAQYEAELAAANGEGNYDEESDE